MVTRAP